MPSLIQRHRGIWYGIFSYEGKRIWRSTETSCKEDAEQIVESLSKEYVSWRNLTILQYRDQLLNLLEGDLARGTLQLYGQALSKFAKIVGDRSLRSLSPYHVEFFKSERFKQVSPTKVSIDFRTLRAAFNRAVKFKMINCNPFARCENIRVPEKTPRFLSRDEFNCLVRIIDDLQLRSIVILAVATGMRLGEIVNMRWENIDLDRGYIHLENRDDFVLKGRRNRSIPLNQTARRVLAVQPRRSEYVFSNRRSARISGPWVSRRFKRYARKAELPEEIHFHSLRHTGASWLVQSNVPISYVKEILGHSSISTTLIYSHSTADHLQESMKKIDGILLN